MLRAAITALEIAIASAARYTPASLCFLSALHSDPHDVSGTALRAVSPLGGAVSERFKEHAWKACRRETVTWVRIPPAPPFFQHDRM